GEYNKGRKLLVMIGNQQATYDAPNVRAGEWQHLAVVRKGQMFLLYLNGTPLCADPDACVFTLQSSDNLPTGTLRFGQRTSSQLINNREAQFYGMLDDVAVFNQALTKSEIQQLVNSPRLTGNESGLMAGGTFDRPATAQTLPPPLPPPVRLTPPAAAVAISADRNNASDAQTLPLPFQQTTMQLPLADEQAWVV